MWFVSLLLVPPFLLTLFVCVFSSTLVSPFVWSDCLPVGLFFDWVRVYGPTSGGEHEGDLWLPQLQCCPYFGTEGSYSLALQQDRGLRPFSW